MFQQLLPEVVISTKKNINSYSFYVLQKFHGEDSYIAVKKQFFKRRNQF